MSRSTDRIRELLLSLDAVRDLQNLGIDYRQPQSLIHRSHHQRRLSNGPGQWELTDATPTGTLFTVYYDHPWRGRQDAVFILAVEER